MEELQPIVGLEIHLQLNTKSKVFCGCNADIWKAKPNTHTCPVCLALPGALPVVNRQTVENTILIGLALNCRANRETYFERKNYFYPDLPKGFQISQKRAPLGQNGYLEAGSEMIDIWEIHLEEDTAKSMHEGEATLIDFNKSGIPLVEVVSAPCIHSVETLDTFAKEIREIVRTLGVSDCNMEKGQMRFEANISIQKSKFKGQNSKLPNYRVEIKNLNSFKSLRDSAAYEIERQMNLIEGRKTPVQETRGWNPEKKETFVQRVKEYAQDYRYFPEPDLPPLEISDELIEELSAKLPELPSQRRVRFEKFGLSKEQAEIISADSKREKYFENVARADITESEAKELVKLIINRPEVMKKSPEEVLKDLGKEKKERVSDERELEQIAERVVAENPQPVSDYKDGKEEALQFLIGQVMRETCGKADPRVARKILKKFLSV